MLRAINKFLRKLGTRPHPEYQSGIAMMSNPSSSPVIVQNWMPTNSAVAYYPSVAQGIDQMTAGQVAGVAAGEVKPAEVRIEKKPVEVVAEILQKEKPVISVNDIDKQIKMVKDRLRVLEQFKGQTSDEKLALRYLEARRYFKKNEKHFPWATTTDEMVQDLVKRYKLQIVGFGGYSKSVPMEATLELEKFGKSWERVVDDEKWEPTLQLIIDYQGPEHKKDPILLASSPFGRWWYVLGAWDKEVEIVDEIVYRKK